MGRSNGKYGGGYRGRRTLTDILRIIAIVLGVAVVLVLAGLFLAQDYIVYTDDGIRLELPFLKEDPENTKGSTPDSGSITVKEEPKGEDEQTTQEETALKALQLPVDSLLDGTAAARMEQEGANALIFEMKGQDGNLAWHSQQALADGAGVNGNEEINEALKQLDEQGVYTIALVCCFRDDSIPYYNTDLALRSAGGNWRDELGLRWMSPASQQAREYVIGLCGELAGLGFDEILLESFAFPVQGDLSRIVKDENYDSAQFAAQIQSLLEELKGALAQEDAALSLRLETEDLTGESSVSGMAAGLLKDLEARLWIGENQRDLEAQLESAGISQKAWVRIVAQLDPEQQDSQGVLSQEIVP